MTKKVVKKKVNKKEKCFKRESEQKGKTKLKKEIGRDADLDWATVNDSYDEQFAKDWDADVDPNADAIEDDD